jgi:hypothetical protein
MIAVAVMGDGGDCGGSSSSNMAVQPGGSIMLPMVITLYIMMVINNNKRNVYLPSLRMKVPDHVYVFGSLLLQ